MAILQQYNSLFYHPRTCVSHYKAIYYTLILTGTMLATSCLRLDMTCTTKNITINDDVQMKILCHTADLHIHVALLKVSIAHLRTPTNVSTKHQLSIPKGFQDNILT